MRGYSKVIAFVVVVVAVVVVLLVVVLAVIALESRSREYYSMPNIVQRTLAVELSAVVSITKRIIA